MTLETVRIRAQVAHEIGVRLDDALEAARGETVRWEGSNQGLLTGHKAILGLLPHVDKDIDEGKYDLATATSIKLYINRAAQVCANLAVQSSTQRAMSQGQIMMGEANVKVVKKFHEEELRRVGAIEAAEAESRAAGKSAGEEESVDLRSRPAGVHPPATIKQQRLAEEAVEAAAAQESARAEAAKAAEAVKAPQEEKPSWTLEQIGLLVKADLAPVLRKKPGPKPKTPAPSPDPVPFRKKPGPKPKPKT